MWSSFDEVVGVLWNEKTQRRRYNYTVANNTKLQVREEDDDGNIRVVALRLHNTDILTFLPTRIVYATGGFFSRTTMNRMNQFGPLQLYTKDHLWMYSLEGQEHVYSDYMQTDYQGVPIFPKTAKEERDMLRKHKWMKEKISLYAQQAVVRYVNREQVIPEKGKIVCPACSSPNDRDRMFTSAALHIGQGEYCPDLVYTMLKSRWHGMSPEAGLYLNEKGEWAGTLDAPKQYQDIIEHTIRQWGYKNLLNTGFARIAHLGYVMKGNKDNAEV